MAMLLPKEITITTERRQVAIMKGDGTERLGFFHKWSENGDEDFALVENTAGALEYIPVHAFRFLPVGDDIFPEKLEEIYKENGIMIVRKTEIEDTKNRCAICLEIIPEGRGLCQRCEIKGWKNI